MLLNPKLVARAQKIFAPNEVHVAITKLTAENFEREPYRVLCAILKVSNGSLDTLSYAIKLAQTDYRDILVSAGFEHDVNAHHLWVDS